MPKKEAGGKSVAKKTTTNKSQKGKTAKKVQGNMTKRKATSSQTKNKRPKKITATKTANKTTKKTVSKKQTASPSKRRNDTKKRQQVNELTLEQLFKKKDIENHSSQSEKETTLPSSMSVRTVEKTLAIHTLLSDAVAERVRRGAYGLSFVFILFGSLYSIQQIADVSSEKNSQIANLINSISSTPQDFKETIEQPLRPELLSQPQLPRTIDSEMTFVFSLANAKSADVVILNVTTGKKITMTSVSLSANRYQFVISPDRLDAGSHEVRIVAATNSGTTQIPAGTFTISSESKRQSTQNDEVVEAEERVAIKTESQSKPGNDTFGLILAPETIEESTILLIRAPTNVTDITLFGLKENAYTAVPLGDTPRKIGSGWQVFFDTKNVPNGTYELFVKGVQNGIEIESTRKKVTINKPLPQTDYVAKQSEVEAIVVSEQPNQDDTEVAERELRQVNQKRDFSEISLLPETGSGSETEDLVTRLLQSEKSDLENLLRNYSVAAQSGNEITKRLAGESLDEYVARLQARDEVVTQVTQAKIAERVVLLRNRIDTFETLRRNKSEEATAADSDGDGISDLDERALFNTDPENPDTDDDGITDGIEIMRGYNPTDRASEVGIVFESPRESIGLTRKDTLSVTKVAPYIVIDSDEEKVVQASITGQALPNSYATLYIFSTPTIVTVKTDSTGAFEYVFTDELEDGQHDVYVAITDNAGKIVAQSEPFTFVKQAEAFTTEPLSSGAEVTSDYVSDNPYSLALGLGLLSLGVVLFMLGIGLRREEPVPVTQS